MNIGQSAADDIRDISMTDFLSVGEPGIACRAKEGLMYWDRSKARVANNGFFQRDFTRNA